MAQVCNAANSGARKFVSCSSPQTTWPRATQTSNCAIPPRTLLCLTRRPPPAAQLTADEKIAQLEKEISNLHETLTRKAVNSRNTTDVFGRTFVLPVDEEHKAKVCGAGQLCSCALPHMRAFWCSTISFFSTFFSVFAPAAIMPYLKRTPERGGLGLTRTHIAVSGSCAIALTIVGRVVAGPLCDLIGARRTCMLLLLAGCPGILALIFATTPEALIVARLFIGIGLASFVTCQVWCSQMFAKSIVGTVNATAAGWGNLGGGVTQLVMPYVMLAMLAITGYDINLSWRLSLIIPLAMHILSCIFTLSARDLPDGNYRELETSGAKQKVKGGSVAAIGFSNINAWILVITYGLCFGVELTMNNKVVMYFFNYYGLSPQIAGLLGSCFGLMNLVARSWGGLLSDVMNKKFDIRGRLWSMWIIQTLEGVMCILMGLVTVDLNGPHEPGYADSEKLQGVFNMSTYAVGDRGMVTYVINGTEGAVGPCASKLIVAKDIDYRALTDCTADAAPDECFRDTAVPLASESAAKIAAGNYPSGYLGTNLTYVDLPKQLGESFMIGDPADGCVRNSDGLALTFILMVGFSIFVQMSEGLHFGVVPYVSRPALGVVSGMVGAGGNLGAVIGSSLIVAPTYPTDEGFINLGIVIMTVSCLMFFLYWPEKGGMLVKAGALGSYDPQIVKPSADMRGADQMNYDNVNVDAVSATKAAKEKGSA